MGDIAFAFEIGGRTIDPGAVDDPVEAEVVREVVESVVDRVGDLVCPEHGQAPRFVCRGEHVGALSLELEGCCEAMVEKVRERMG